VGSHKSNPQAVVARLTSVWSRRPLLRPGLGSIIEGEERAPSLPAASPALQRLRCSGFAAAPVPLPGVAHM
jgi:hypothetical protein